MWLFACVYIKVPSIGQLDLFENDLFDWDHVQKHQKNPIHFHKNVNVQRLLFHNFYVGNNPRWFYIPFESIIDINIYYIKRKFHFGFSRMVCCQVLAVQFNISTAIWWIVFRKYVGILMDNQGKNWNKCLTRSSCERNDGLWRPHFWLCRSF